MAPYQPRIAIVGAGPAGLTLGVLLYKRGIPFTIYESRQRPTEEELARPSGMLDLHDESGLAALRACGLFDEFVPLSAECAQSMILTDGNGKVIFNYDGSLEYRPGISRHSLSKLLRGPIPPECIKWGSKLCSASIDVAGNVALVLDSGAACEFDLVIGADGAWSRVRPLLTSEKPHYAGVQYITLTITDVSTKYPYLSELVGKGAFFALVNHHGVISHRGAQDSVRLFVAISFEDESCSYLAGLSAAELKERLLNEPVMFSPWGTLTKELLSAGCDEEGAANPEPPVGVNLAMQDVLELSDVIAEVCEQPVEDGAAFRERIAPLMRGFERGMFNRAEQMAERTWRNRNIMFADDGANGMAEMFRGFFSTACRVALA